MKNWCTFNKLTADPEGRFLSVTLKYCSRAEASVLLKVYFHFLQRLGFGDFKSKLIAYARMYCLIPIAILPL